MFMKEYNMTGGKSISRLQYITTNPVDAEKACRAGVDWIQLRVKKKPEKEWKTLAEETLIVCRRYGAKLIINDNVLLAKEIEADGVHLGKEDMNPAEARLISRERPMPGEKFIPAAKFIIGGTANTIEDVNRLVGLGVDYIGLGPFRFTTTKMNLSPVLGLAGYSAIISQLEALPGTIPVIAIGGIKVEDVSDLLKTGVYGIAVSSAITQSDAIGIAATGFITELKNNEQKKPQISISR
jgi:thiamine-phosphate pyrophosphorylase